MRIIFLKDSEINKWLINEFSKTEFQTTFVGIKNKSTLINSSRLVRIIRSHIDYFTLASKGLLKSNRNDVIVCWLDIVGFYVFILSKFFNKKRKVVVLNIMYNKGPDIVAKIKYSLFKWMLSNKNIYPTVTSKTLQKYYNSIFKLKEKSFDLVHDCYGSIESYKRKYKEGKGYVFCGGTNSRDWSLMKTVAKNLPSIEFIIVGPKKDSLDTNYPKNIKYYYNVGFEKFQNLLAESSLCVLPLNTNAPAGLIVLYTAALMSKPVITTNNVTMSEYIIPGEEGLLIGINDSVAFANAIDLVMKDELRLKKMAENLHKKIVAIGSPKSYVKAITRIIKKIHLENIANK